MKSHWKMLVLVLLIAATATGLALNSWTRAQVVGVFKQLSQGRDHSLEGSSERSWKPELTAKMTGAWDHVLTLEPNQIRAIGLKTVPVKQQVETTTLKLFGTSDYDPATVTVVRTHFDSRVDRVLVKQGSTVKIGDPLLELFSTDLAEAKSNYEAAISQWARDKKVLDYKKPLAEGNNIARKEVFEVQKTALLAEGFMQPHGLEFAQAGVERRIDFARGRRRCTGNGSASGSFVERLR